MAVLEIIKYGHPTLLRRAEPVSDPTAPEVRKLAFDMIDTMHAASGAGLAAPQVDVGLRLFVFRVSDQRTSRDPDDIVMDDTVIVNPAIETIGVDNRMRWEGCLSIPGLRAAVPRAWRIRYSGVDLEARPITRIVTGFHAGVVQHEYDHLDGILYTMRMADFSLMGFTDELSRHFNDAPAPVGDGAASVTR